MGVSTAAEQVDAWAAKAEAGYEVAALKKRGRGRPGSGSEPSQVAALRFTIEKIAAIDARAEREGKSRSWMIREVSNQRTRTRFLSAFPRCPTYYL
ncbi:MAG: ribbon-helix-helix domain-containing protein [Actinobacteria bacterium]|nr:ribbon-helix-helix domain-containing protein [Actinomycetota bacterium]